MRIFNLLFLGNILLLMMLSSCEKDEENNDLSKNNITIGQTGIFTDSRDNKTYKWVGIGEQIWMSENLSYTGDDIRHITDIIEWIHSPYDGYCFYEDNDSLANIYGVLYQWNAAKIACPTGWHLPSEEEWLDLENYLKDNGYSYNEVIGDNGIAISLAKNSNWSISDNKGAVGNPDYPNFRNQTGFSALPSGSRNHSIFEGLGNHTVWWCSTESSSSFACYRRLSYGISDIYPGTNIKYSGFSVRCIRD